MLASITQHSTTLSSISSRMQKVKLQREKTISSFNGGIGMFDSISIQRTNMLISVSVPSSKIFPLTTTNGSGSVSHHVMKSSLKRLQEAVEMSDSDDCVD